MRIITLALISALLLAGCGKYGPPRRPDPPPVPGVDDASQQDEEERADAP